MAIIALSAGHNKNTGAVALDGTDEWAFNIEIVTLLAEILRCDGHKVIILKRDKSLGYTSAMRKLGREMKAAGVELGLELHFNSSSNPNARGFEFLHWWRSKESEFLAECLGTSHGEQFPSIPQRGSNKGARSIWFHRWNQKRAYSGRGGAYCYLTPCPAVICEWGFASNFSDWFTLRNNQYQIAQSVVKGIDLYLK